jgi:hypothetical protein
MGKYLPLATLAFWLCGAAPLAAEYTLVLKNGRRITVESYREEGGMIKFYGMGGEIGIAKEQVESIVEAGESGRGIDVQRAERLPGAQEDKGKVQESLPAEPHDAQVDQRAREAKEYARRLQELTEQIKSAEERYLQSARGSSAPEPTLLNSEEAIRARTDDLNSRLRDAQHNPAGPADAGGVQLTTPSPFTGMPPTVTEIRPGPVIPRVDAPPPPYTAREKELSELRGRVNQLHKERERLMQEMKEKNIQPGAGTR